MLQNMRAFVNSAIWLPSRVAKPYTWGRTPHRSPRGLFRPAQELVGAGCGGMTIAAAAATAATAATAITTTSADGCPTAAQFKDTDDTVLDAEAAKYKALFSRSYDEVAQRELLT